MDAIAYIFDPKTHVYSYFYGCVVTREQEAMPRWQAIETRPPAADWPWESKWVHPVFAAPDEKSAMKRARASASFKDGVITELKRVD